MKTNQFLNFLFCMVGILGGSTVITYSFLTLENQGFWEVKNNVVLFSIIFFVALCFSLYFFWLEIKKNRELVYIKDSIIFAGIAAGITTSIKAFSLLLIFN